MGQQEQVPHPNLVARSVYLPAELIETAERLRERDREEANFSGLVRRLVRLYATIGEEELYALDYIETSTKEKILSEQTRKHRKARK